MQRLTSSKSPLKHFSSKPLLITTRDAVLVTVVTLIATIIIMYFVGVVTNTPNDWWVLIVQSLVFTMGSQYFYEYSGVNNMIAESSMRYAKGSTLSKYRTRRSAMVCDVHNALRDKYDVSANYAKLKSKLANYKQLSPDEQFILDRMSPEMIADMLVNDATFTVEHGILFSSVKEEDERGAEILQKCGFYDV